MIRKSCQRIKSNSAADDPRPQPPPPVDVLITVTSDGYVQAFYDERAANLYFVQIPSGDGGEQLRPDLEDDYMRQILPRRARDCWERNPCRHTHKLRRVRVGDLWDMQHKRLCYQAVDRLNQFSQEGEQ